MSDDSPKTVIERRNRSDRRSPDPAPFAGTERRVGPRRSAAETPPAS